MISVSSSIVMSLSKETDVGLTSFSVKPCDCPAATRLIFLMTKSVCFSCSRLSVITLPFLIMATHASITSVMLWVGIFVAIPTAIPSLPIKSRFGRSAGRYVGSLRVASKLSIKSQVSFSISVSMESEIWASLTSV